MRGQGRRHNPSFETPFNAANPYYTSGWKGKILPLPIGNEIIISSMLGYEYGFRKNQSVGIDAFFSYDFGSHDNVYDTAGVKHEVGNYFHQTEKALYLNYRYYFNFSKIRAKTGIAFYTGLFVRYGVVTGVKDPLFVNTFIEKTEKHYSGGILLGTLIRFTKTPHWGY